MIIQNSIRDIQQRMSEDVPQGRADDQTVRRLWWAALETLQQDILLPMELSGGIWLASPLPALYETKLLEKLQGWIWAPEELDTLYSPLAGMLPPSPSKSVYQKQSNHIGKYRRLPLRNEDGYDPLLMIITPEIQVALALQGKQGERKLLLRSDKETFSSLLQILDSRLKTENYDHAKELRNYLADLVSLRSNNQLERIFWPKLSERLASMMPSLMLQTLPVSKSSNNNDQDSGGDVTLLEAMTHEIRTPLATIRTLIRSLLRQKQLSETVINRLRQIDSECTEQIDRFGLIFNAAELQREQPKSSNLASTNLGSILQTLQASWSMQLERRGVALAIEIAPDLPHVLSDPQRLELMLGGLIDRSSRGLQPGGILSLRLTPAGSKLKLQILSQSQTPNNSESTALRNSSDIGPVLSWDPITGNLQLSQEATQRLLKSLGGRLANRRDSAITVFFPITGSKY